MARLILLSSLVLLLLSPVTPPAAAQQGEAPALSQIYLDWIEGPARHLLTKQEREAWSQVANDREAEDFVRLFWARRDPTPETPDNEFRREFERRAAYADQRFGEVVDNQEVRGSLTDRGRALILLGPPRRVQDPGAGGSTTGGDFGTGGDVFSGRAVGSGGGPVGRGGATDRFGVASEEIWIYEGDDRPEYMKKRRVQVTFRTKPGTEEVEIYNGEEALGYMGEAIERAVVRPELTLADLAPATGSELEAAAGAEGFGLFGAESLDDAAALEALRASLSGDGGGSVPAHLDAGAFQASDGTWIVPVQVAVEGQAPAGDAVLVGELVGADGETKVSFRAEPEWKESRDQRYAKATVVAAPGEYTLRAGLRSPGGEVLWSEERQVAVPAGGGDELWLSQVVLSEDIHPMPQAQQVLEPWAWMGIEVVPEGDRTFEQGSVLWQYVHACHAALGESGKPNLRVTVQLTGPASFRGPASVDPVKAGDNCWVLASAYDLVPDRFPPGDYTMALTVRDSVAGKSVVTESVSFTVAPSGG